MYVYICTKDNVFYSKHITIGSLKALLSGSVVIRPKTKNISINQ